MDLKFSPGIHFGWDYSVMQKQNLHVGGLANPPASVAFYGVGMKPDNTEKTYRRGTHGKHAWIIHTGQD